MVKSKLSILKGATFSIGIASIILSALLIFTSAINASIPAPSGVGTTCPNGEEIYCSGVRCSVNATSCTCTDRNGHVTDRKVCPRS